MEAVNNQLRVRVDGTATRPAASQSVDGLTPRETEVLDMVGQALTNRAIAGRLGLSEKTVKAHVTAVMKKLGAHNRVEAALIAERHRNLGGRGR